MGYIYIVRTDTWSIGTYTSTMYSRKVHSYSHGYSDNCNYNYSIDIQCVIVLERHTEYYHMEPWHSQTPLSRIDENGSVPYDNTQERSGAKQIPTHRDRRLSGLMTPLGLYRSDQALPLGN